MLLSELILLGAVTLWRALRDGERGWLPGDGLLRALPVATFPVFLLAMYLPLTGRILELTALDFTRWVWVFAIAGAGWGTLWLVDRFLRVSDNLSS